MSVPAQRCKHSDLIFSQRCFSIKSAVKFNTVMLQPNLFSFYFQVRMFLNRCLVHVAQFFPLLFKKNI